VKAAEPYAHLRDKDGLLLAALRNAEAIQVLTPAPDKLAIEWKRKIARKHPPIAVELLDKAIAADEQWLRDHPTRQGRPRKAVRS
jgi:hypothetical protein